MIVLLIVHAGLAWINRAFVAGLWHDEAQYMLLARSVRQFKYVDFYLLGSPVESQYPPGLPAFFALISLPFGEHVQLLIAAVVLCSVGGLALLYDIVRCRSGSQMALLVLALSAVNPEIVLYAGRTLGEQPYLLFSMLALWLVMRESPATSEVPSRSSWRIPLVTIVAAIYAALVRTVGVTLLAAILVTWSLEKRFRRVLAVVAAGALTVGSWALWLILVPTHLVGRSYVADATFSPQQGLGLFGVLWQRITTNVSDYVTTQIPNDLPLPSLAALGRHLPGISPESVMVGALADRVVGIFAVAILAITGVWALWHQARAAIIYLASYLALLALWPWHQSRFLVPVLPLILWVIVAGAAALAKQWRWFGPLRYGFVAAVLAMACARDLSTFRDTVACDREAATTSAECYSETERGFFAAMTFIGDSTPRTAVVVTTADTQLGYFSERRALFPRGLTRLRPEALFDTLRTRGAEYVLLTPIRPPDEQLFPVLQAGCENLLVVKEFSAVTLLLRVSQTESKPPQNACVGIERYAKAGMRSVLW